MRAKKISALSLAAAMAVCTVPAFGATEAATENTTVPKYIFLFIGDGMSYPQVQTTNYYLNAIADDGDDVLTSESKLNMMKFPVAGSAQTYDSTSFCPDSASTATSISTGHKTYSGTINMDEKMETSYETIAEKLKKQLGYKVGILSSVNLNHATPAAFYAHQPSRNNYYEIGQEMIASEFDYFAGGGLKKTTGSDNDKTDLYQLAEEAGYKVIKTQAEAEALTAEDGKAIVIDETLADSDAMSYDMDLEEGEWGLSDYVEKGIEVLDNDTGFFMMVEGGKIDWACSAYFYSNGTMSEVYAIGMTISAFMLYASLECAGNYSSLLHVVSVCVDKANAILELNTMDIDGKEIQPENYDIKLSNVTFSYDKRKIIDDVSLSIPQKTTTAIVGPSGGGKSTLCNLIARFWDVDLGEVTLGGVNVKDYSMNSLMSNFAFVFQSVYLFADTIENNIKFGRQEASHEEVVEAAKKACCHDFISKLPNGYDIVIGEGGATLSGGEKQRISIARAIMKDAPIIILDEATANVDPENEKELVEAVDALTKEKTIIMIAHRLKTVRHADQIVVVDKGRIAQKGPHEQLMKQEGIYKRFVDARQQAVSWKL